MLICAIIKFKKYKLYINTCNNNNIATSIPEHVFPIGVCQAPGLGTLGEPCDHIGDSPCQEGLRCHTYTYECVTIGNGTLGDYCDSELDAPCNETLGFTCRKENALNGDGDLMLISRCRQPANGVWKSACGSPLDRTCSSTVCQENSLKNTVCELFGSGVLGQRCGRPGDMACSAGTLCGNTAANEYKTCRQPGNGTALAYCAETGDASCMNSLNLTCVVETPLYSLCREHGQGEMGQSCQRPGDLRVR